MRYIYKLPQKKGASFFFTRFQSSYLPLTAAISLCHTCGKLPNSQYKHKSCNILHYHSARNERRAWFVLPANGNAKWAKGEGG